MRTGTWLLGLSLLLAACGGDDDGAPTRDASDVPPNPDSDGGPRAPDGGPPVEPDDGGPMASPGDGGPAVIKPRIEVPRPGETASFGWKPCGEGTRQCGTLRLPIDYDKPDGDTVKIAVMRRLASGTRLGSLFLNPGGPGSSAVDYLGFFVDEATSPLLAHFDLLAFDPRGVNYSTGIDCHSTLQRYVSTSLKPNDEASFQVVNEASRVFAAECAGTANRALLPHMTTVDVARDMDRIRAALGEDKLNYLGFSYGSAIGAWYAELFPSHVGKLVLDGAVDPRLSMLDTALDQAKGFELALSRYFAWCRADAARCPWAEGMDPAQALAALEAAVAMASIPAPMADRPLGPGELDTAVSATMYGGLEGWRALSSGLRGARAGDASRLMTFVDGYLERNLDGTYPNVQEAYFAYTCMDGKPLTVEELRAATPRFLAASPSYGMSALGSLLMCAHWPVQGVDLPSPTGKGAPPLLVLGTRNDPATPYAWATSLAGQLESAVLLTLEGDGHTAYERGVPCIDQAVESFLFDGVVPGPITCESTRDKSLADSPRRAGAHLSARGRGRASIWPMHAY